MLCHSIGKSLINILKTLEYFVTHWKPTFLKVISVQDTFPNQIHFFFLKPPNQYSSRQMLWNTILKYHQLKK